MLAGQSEDRIPIEVRFFAPIQTSPGVHLASNKRGTELFPRVKPPGRGVNHLPPTSAEVKVRVQLHFHYPFRSTSTVLQRNLFLP